MTEPGTPMPANSEVVIDGYSIKMNSMYATLWYEVAKRSIKAGDFTQAFLSDPAGNSVSILISPHSTLRVHNSVADIPEVVRDEIRSEESRTNLPVLVKHYIVPGDHYWATVEHLGIDKAIAALDADS